MGVVDTNVVVVSNGRNANPDACVDACVDHLAEYAKGSLTLYLDSGGEILTEYGKNVQHGTPQGVGDAFFIWAVTHQATLSNCTQVKITPEPNRGYAEFPEDPLLRSFDMSDRKFVAVAIASGHDPTIYNATDSDWAVFAVPLARHVKVKELCLKE